MMDKFGEKKGQTEKIFEKNVNFEDVLLAHCNNNQCVCNHNIRWKRVLGIVVMLHEKDRTNNSSRWILKVKVGNEKIALD